MTTPPPSPQIPAGWYPDPGGSPQQRWWDGLAWTEHLGPHPLPQAPVHRAAAKPVRPFASAAQIGVGSIALILLLVLILNVAVYRAVRAAAQGVADPGELEQLDRVLRALPLLAVVVVAIGGVLWMVWQYRAAVAVGPGLLRRGPAWHAWSWVIPVITWWFPYQNLADLWRAAGRPRPRWLPLWWGLWVAGSILNYVSSRLAETADDLDAIAGALVLGIVGTACFVAAAPLAFLVVGQVTDAIEGRPESR